MTKCIQELNELSYENNTILPGEVLIDLNKKNTQSGKIKPFVKWVGGKSFALKYIKQYYPETINKYCEPFVGGGAVLFDILSNYNVEDVLISDLNKELINTYITIKYNIEELINELKKLKTEYMKLSITQRDKYFYVKRNEFNEYIQNKIKNKIYGSALFIFINKTCFNGLYRVNSKGLFNTPAGRYKNPEIYDEENLRNISKKLEKVKIINDSYSSSIDFIDENTLVYFDPPYRPLNKTSNFISYNTSSFGDLEQIELANYFKKVNNKKAKAILSNSDPKNVDINDNFFDDLYSGFNINRIKVKRYINSNGKKRGDINEILVTNFKN
ncbi:Dam family site-specific DNA-(adenine-N6)-methyltransferase [Mycoplasma zalophi]|uniref:Dam family site-specific DNA-(Adenine-N6)-methyltransferase n=1 Tax=Mycoplasma zalophi TaxID=191287 RepID=A0ABS6DPN8_9MOLU|nr:Dam family site-specific DNA-(adenine-N6)-methyltransferase [Mycoplasma zalophi]MBU4692289.1 Dam family site-specific DNA-(adenine-N6)-methyltransferase [Mycoplasma zalophi]MCU4117244.1 Dam family site-specific DNA-(adenine-N6)-methyltransferase [Mycoplasma zalophi]